MEAVNLRYIALALLTAVVLLFAFNRNNNNSKEFYGGPVKNVRKVPISDCYRRCDIWMSNCMRDRPGDEHRCVEMGEACRAECYYSNSHRQ